jgi:hypothetical protein
MKKLRSSPVSEWLVAEFFGGGPHDGLQRTVHIEELPGAITANGGRYSFQGFSLPDGAKPSIEDPSIDCDYWDGAVFQWEPDVK